MKENKFNGSQKQKQMHSKHTDTPYLPTVHRDGCHLARYQKTDCFRMSCIIEYHAQHNAGP